MQWELAQPAPSQTAEFSGSYVYRGLAGLIGHMGWQDGLSLGLLMVCNKGVGLKVAPLSALVLEFGIRKNQRLGW